MHANDFEKRKSLTGQAVILAAGESSRFWPLNKEHKSLLYLLGKPIIYWTVKGLVESGVKDIVVVCKKESQIPLVLQKENDLQVSLRFVFQEESLGTGSALLQAREFITGDFFAVWPNKVNAKDIVQKILEKQKQENAEAVLVGAATLTPWDYGMARLEGERMLEIVENPERGKEPSSIKVIGFYYLQKDFFEYYDRVKRREADFIDALNLYLKDRRASMVEIEKDVPALKYPWELFGILDILFAKQTVNHYVAPSAKIGEGTVIQGPVYIGEDCEIGPHNILRGPLSIGRGVKTGAFCEIKYSIVQEGTHFHSGYIGDSIIGKDCRFGAGFISANRRLDRASIFSFANDKKVDTGLSYLGTAVGDNARIGIHSGTMPGVFIGSGSVIGPGTMVAKNVPNNTILYTQFEQITKKRN